LGGEGGVFPDLWGWGNRATDGERNGTKGSSSLWLELKRTNVHSANNLSHDCVGEGTGWKEK